MIAYSVVTDGGNLLAEYTIKEHARNLVELHSSLNLQIHQIDIPFFRWFIYKLIFQ